MSYSGLFDGHYGTPHTLLDGDNTNQKTTRLLGRRRMNRKTNALMNALLGVVPGSTAASTYKRVVGPDGLTESAKLGGLRETETVTVINRSSVAADATALKAVLNDQFQPDTYVPDASGNGGGGKQEAGL